MTINQWTVSSVIVEYSHFIPANTALRNHLRED
jgi:hypothetical protein